MSVDNRTQLNNCETFANGWTAAAQGGDNTTTGQFYEGTGSIESQHSNSDEETFTVQDSGGATFNLDLSDSTVYILIKDNLIDTFANGGVQYIIGDGSNRIGYDVGDIGNTINKHIRNVTNSFSQVKRTISNL